jgi:glycosyltransferase involved in cell wall biosynthesis
VIGGRRLRGNDVVILHRFRKPPYGGANQFLLALVGELRRRGLRVGSDRVSKRTRACLLHAFLVDVDRVRAMLPGGCRVVHRVDGPVAGYRGFDDGSDAHVAAVNRQLAHATVLQSAFSLDASRAAGLDFVDPHVIWNAPDPRLFHRPPVRRRPVSAPLRVIVTSWSDNANKGADTLEWLDAHLDPRLAEITFVGRTSARLERIRTVAPVDSRRLGELLRGHDAYLAPSREDPCSNALLEALACGLPAIYARSGGHPELVGQAGFAFDRAEDIPDALGQLTREYDERRERIAIPALTDVADAYLAVMGLG